jgi:hypothetical protein
VNVLALTIFVSFVLGAMFAVLCLLQAVDARNFSARDALMPLERDAPEPASTDSRSPS